MLSNRPDECNILGGFDIVIGNPPYKSSKMIKKEEKEEYKKYYISADSQMDLFSLFVEQSNKLLKVNAVSSLIVPDSLVGRKNFSTTRNEIICKRTILSWLHINNVFEQAEVANVIYVLKNLFSDDYAFTYVKADNVTNWINNQVSEQLIKKSSVEQNEYYAVLFSSNDEQSLLKKLNDCKRLSSKLFSWRGEEIGRKSSLISHVNSKNSKPLLAGDGVHRYENVVYSRYIKLTDVQKDNYFRPKILIRQLGTCINATLDIEGCISMQSIYNLVVADNDEKYLKFILGILNSKMLDFVYKSLSKDKKSFQRIILDNVKKLPLPPLETSKSIIISLVEDILKAKKSNPKADTSKQEQEIDFWVYKLYRLTYNEVLIVDPETTITREEYEKQ